MNKWSHKYTDELAEEVYINGVDPNNEQLWNYFVLAFVWHFRDIEEEKAWAQLLNIEITWMDILPGLRHFSGKLKEIDGRQQTLISSNKD